MTASKAFDTGGRRSTPDFSKMVVEDPVIASFDDLPASPGNTLANGTSIETSARPLLLKDVVERPINARIDWNSLARDTEYNRQVRYAKASAIVSEKPAHPADLTTRVYRDVLDVDLEDPYLGLAPYALGGEGGRFTGAAPAKRGG